MKIDTDRLVADADRESRGFLCVSKDVDVVFRVYESCLHSPGGFIQCLSGFLAFTTARSGTILEARNAFN